MRLIQNQLFAAVALAWSMPAWAQTAPPIDAGRLLEQQRRSEAPPPALTPGSSPPTVARPTAPTPAKPAPAGGIQTTVRSFQFVGTQLLSEADLQQAVAPWRNRPVTVPDLYQAGAAVETLFRERGWLAKVTLPSQDVTEGVVRFDILVALRGNIQVTSAGAETGAETGGTLRLSRRIESLFNAALPADVPLSLVALERSLLVANDLPGVAVSGSLQASATAGRTDALVVATMDAQPAHADVSLDNMGSRATGAERANAQLVVSSALGMGERAEASMPLTFPWQAGWTGWRVGVNASGLRFRVLDSQNTTTGLSPEGTSNTVGLGVQYPLIRTPLANWQLAVGLEEKRLTNKDDDVTLGILTTTNNAVVHTATLGFSGSQFDHWAGGGGTYANLSFTAGRLNLDGSSAALLANDLAQANTQGDFQKMRYSLSRYQSLADALGDGFSVFASLTGQLASTNLDASERFYLGGANGVRAYPSGEAGGSTGRLFTLELRRQLDTHWQVGAFYDYGQVDQYRNNNRADGTGPLLGANSVALAGAGLLVSWRAANGAQLKATWAQRIGDNPLATNTGNDTDGSRVIDRLWFSASIPF
jgi:hemolysin activation/secretion protein